MSFFNDVLIKLGFDLKDAIGGDCVTFCQGKGVLLEGHKGISLYTQERIVVLIYGGKISVEGNDLEIIEITETELYVRGKILCVSREA